ncbi:STAS domain-containing protein [Micromonospora sp. URMC 103]|uniref:STAS domain-containing protein n=1 Tax=Micromonospora sp. URMC 103 TaxID=3423406 RepID=UPI003F1D2EEB
MNTFPDRGLLRCDVRDVSPGLRHVTVSGEADLATADQLERDLTASLSPAWVTHLALDLTRLRYLDCAALSVLMAVRQAALARDQQVTIAAATGSPERVLALTSAGQIFGYPPLPHGIRYQRTRRPLRGTTARAAS